jgi:TorA maturation chaperone TorD
MCADGENKGALRASGRDTQQLAAASDLCQLLAHFCHLPSLELVAALVAGSLLADARQILEELGIGEEDVAEATGLLAEYTGEGTDAAGQEALLHELRVDYTQLFTHPLHPAVPIYEALLLYEVEPQGGRPQLFTNPEALDCEHRYSQAGLRRSVDFNESADHLGTQLEFLGFLFGLALAQTQQGDPALDDTLERLDGFLASHWQRWAEPFFKLVGSRAQTPAYQAFARMGLCVAPSA